MPKESVAILEAGHGRQGTFFTLIKVDDQLFVHLLLRQGYQVFCVASESEAVRVNNALADLHEQGRKESQSGTNGL